MELLGNLRKMSSTLEDIVCYTLNLNNHPFILNDLLNRKLSIEFTGEINCIKCGRKTTKSFAQGYCYPCFQNAPETEECVLHPELCQAHMGIARDMEFASEHCLIDHYVYLSLTSNIKVGVTRYHQVPTRWIDQGATEALIIAKTPNRYTAGQIEVSLKKIMADKTNWRNMLTGKTTSHESLTDKRKEVASFLPDEYMKYLSNENSIQTIRYPLLKTPLKVTSVNLDKTPAWQGTLTGIKGQYIILDNQYVLNIRKYGGYKVQFTF